MGVMSGLQRLVVAGGVESMSRVAMGADGAGQDGGNGRLREHFFQVPQGISADLIATLDGFSREEVDAWALQSQLRAAEAVREGRFDRSLVPVRDPESGATLLERDEYPRPDTTAAGLAALAPSFAGLGAKPLGPGGETHDEIVRRAYPQAAEIHHVHTAGNSSGIVDGAAAVLIGDAEAARALGLEPGCAPCPPPAPIR